ncbi:hypothetical protein TIFTF001_028607 [Ficus carica]|uniref:CCHC-type domain-containing protein n=1 Tax=Ficus carica TaxID=3494 RepID=A0AA88DQ28_FICCA|nr:hypothetical protein TIFTF001_028607 [Ficus carica]
MSNSLVHGLSWIGLAAPITPWLYVTVSLPAMLDARLWRNGTADCRIVTNVAEPGSLVPNPKRNKAKGKNKGNKPVAKAPAPKKSTKTKKRKVDPKNAKCFFCGKKGHFNRHFR